MGRRTRAGLGRDVTRRSLAILGNDLGFPDRSEVAELAIEVAGSDPEQLEAMEAFQRYGLNEVDVSAVNGAARVSGQVMPLDVHAGILPCLCRAGDGRRRGTCWGLGRKRPSVTSSTCLASLTAST